MTNNKAFLKGILATASSLAITLGAVDAMAAANVHVTLNAAPAAAGARTNVDLVLGQPRVNAAVNQNSLKLNEDRTDLKVKKVTVANSFTEIRGIDVNGKESAALGAGAQAFSLGVVTNSVDDKKLSIIFTGARTLTLTGEIEGAGAGVGIKSTLGGTVPTADALANDYSALGNIDFKDKDATLKIDLANPAPTIISSDIGSSNTNNKGKLQITNGDVTFTGNIGATKALSEIIIDDTKSTTFTGNKVNAQTITIGGAGGGSVKFGNAGGTEIISDLIKGSAPGAAPANKNLIKIENKATLNAVVGANINGIEILAGSTLTVKAKAIAATAEITLEDAAAKVIFTENGYNVLPTINGKTADAQGIIEVNATNVTFGGIIGATQKVNKLVVLDNKSAIINADASFDGAGAADTGIILGNGAKLTVNAGKNLAFGNAAAINGSAAGKGHLVLMNVNTTVDVGATFALEQITLNNLNGGAAIALANRVTAGTFNLANATKLILDANVIGATDIKSDGDAANRIILNNDSTIDFNVGEAPAGNALNIELTGAAAKNLTLGNAAAKTIYGNITNEQGGKLTIKTGITGMKVVGNLGAAQNLLPNDGDLAAVEIGVAAAHPAPGVDHSLEVTGNIYAPVEFKTAGSELVLGAASEVNGAITGTVASTGKVVANGLGVKFNAAVNTGDLTINAASDATLSENTTFANGIVLAAADSVLKLANDGKTLTSKINGAGKVEVAGDWTIDGNVVAGVSEISFTAAKTLTVAAGKDLATHIKGAGTVVFAGATNSAALDFGTAALSLTEVKFSGAGAPALVRDIYATDITVDAGALVTAANFKGNLNLAGAASHFTLADNGTAYHARGAGEFFTAGNATLKNDIAAAKFTMQGVGIVNVDTNNLRAGEINQGAQILRLQQDLTIANIYKADGATINLNGKTLTFGGATEIKDSTLDLANKTITFNAASQFKGNNIITIDYTSNADMGKIVGAVANKITLDAGAVVNVTVALRAATPAANAEIAFIENIVGDATKVVFTVNDNTGAALPAAKYDAGKGKIGILKFLADAAPAAPAEKAKEAPVAVTVKAAVDAISAQLDTLNDTTKDMPTETQAKKLHAVFTEAYKNNKTPDALNQLDNKLDIAITDAVKKAKQDTTKYDVMCKGLAIALEIPSAERLKHIIGHSDLEKDLSTAPSTLKATAAAAEKREDAQHKTVATVASHHAGAAVNAIMDGAGARISSVTIPVSVPTNTIGGSDLQTSAEGIAAGSAVEKHGVWGQVMGGAATQKARKGASGFKSNMFGSMIGADTMISDNTTIGIAFGNVVNNAKMKDIQSGDKTRSSSWVLSGYGNHQFENDFFIRGAVAYTRTAMNSKDLRHVGNQKGIAQAKYKINSFGGEFAVGKAFAVNDFSVIPSIGARFTHTGKISYKETGNTGLNTKIAQGAMNSASAIAGLQVMKTFINNSTIITPEAHVNAQYGLGTKTPTGKFTSDLDNKTVSYKGDKPSRFSTNVGAGVTAQSGSVEYGVSYDANIAPGYVGHQGTLKLKVKF